MVRVILIWEKKFQVNIPRGLMELLMSGFALKVNLVQKLNQPASLLDLLVLHINGQLSTSFSGKLTAVDGTLAPNISADLFKQSRIQGRTTSKRDRQGFLKIIVESKKREKKDADDFQAKLWKAPTCEAVPLC